jgi:two-component system nitrate/nitrite response regulator NarL
MATLVIGDDHDLFADALGTVLTHHGFTVLDVIGTLAATVASVRALRPDVCLLDRHFTDGEGTGVIGDLRTASAATKVIMLTADRDHDGMAIALAAGAAGYVHKSRGLDTLVGAIKRAHEGDVVVELPSAGTVHRRGNVDVLRLADYLTNRERQCLALLTEGMDTAAMARKLNVSATTVRTHVQAVLTKLGVHSRLQAASLAVRHSLVDGANLFPGAPPSHPTRS